MQVSDDIYLGGFLVSDGGPPPIKTTSENPTAQQGVGPMGRVAFRVLKPLTASTTNIATAQHMTNGTGLTLTAGTGITSGTAPDGSGSTVLQTDVSRCISLTSTSNLSAINFTLTGYDEYGRKTTSLLAGPNNNTVYFPKSVVSVLSIVPNTTDGTHNVSAGTSDIFGLQWCVVDATQLVSVLWNNSFVTDTGTFTVADQTSPATSSTGDPRGTYAPSSSSNGSKQLVIGMHLLGTQAGPTATLTAAIGVTPV